MNAAYLFTNGDSITNLAVPLEVQGYGCGVIEMNGKVVSENREPLYLCSNICEESYVGNIKLPVLRQIKRNQSGIVGGTISHIIWLRVMRPNISNIRLYIADKFRNVIPVKNNKLNCTLLFIPAPSK